MKKSLTYLLVIVGCDLFFYALFNDLIYSSICSVLFMLIFKMFISKNLNSSLKQVSALSFGHRFINSMLVQLSSTPSVYESLQKVQIYLNSPFLEDIQFDKNDYIQQLNNLACRLNIQLFFVFIKILELYEVRGGDPLTMNYTLLEDFDTIKVKTDSLYRSKKHKLYDFLTMWGLFGAISLYIRFGLEEFYLDVATSSTFTIGLLVVVMISLISASMFFRNYGKMDLQYGDKI